MRRGTVIVAFACACSAERANNSVTIEHEPPRPVATVDASLLPPSERAKPAANACLMLYECGCNSGCASIDHAASTLRAGMQVGVTSGPLKGTSVFVAKSPTDTGELVFTIQRADPNAAIVVCGTPRSGAFGYLCNTKDMGHARACTSCE